MKNPLLLLGTNTLWYGLGQVLNRFISFLLLPVLTKYLAPSDYGVMGNLALVGLVLVPLLSLGFDAAAGPCYFAGSERAHKEATIGTESAILVSAAILMAVLSWRGAGTMAGWVLGDGGYADLLRVWLWGCAVEMALVPCRHFLMFEQRVKVLTGLNLASTVLTMVLTLYLVIGRGWGLMGLVAARTWGLVGAVLMFYAAVASSLRFRWSGVVARELLRVGLLFMPTIVLLVLLQHGNKYLLPQLRGLPEAGLYNVGFNLGWIMAMPVASFQSAWYPFFMAYAERREEASRLFGRVLTYYTLGFGSLCILFFLAARPIIEIMTAAPFHGAAQAVGLTALAQGFIGMFYVLLPGMYLAKEPHAQSLVLTVSTAIAIALNYWLIRQLGVMGAAIALALSAFVLVMTTHLWNRFRGAAYLQVHYEGKRLVLFALVVLGYGLASLLHPEGSFGGETALSLGLMLPLPVLVYALLSKEERRALGRLRQFKSVVTAATQAAAES